MVNNSEFLNALFGKDASTVHVTGFHHDPSNIPVHQERKVWFGGYFSQYNLTLNTNQYFTISNFHADENGTARRRKALFKHTPVIVLDDVKEKLSMDEVNKLPAPSWILETSKGSEQWGYILDVPCSDRGRVENLLDGLVANGLAPQGKDPGMKGVTRYVRLPDGINNKSSKLIGGIAWKCRLTLWEPQQRVTIQELATPFSVDLDIQRRESRTDGAADISDHPLLSVEMLHVKEVRSDGRFDVTCPWVDEHTDSNDSGSAVFTNGDGTIGFKCHHGACQNRTGKDLLDLIESHRKGFIKELADWQVIRSFKEIKKPEASFTEQKLNLFDELRREPPGSPDSLLLAEQLLKSLETTDEMEKLCKHEELRCIMGWNKSDFKGVLKDLRSKWYEKKSFSFFDDTVFVGEINQFFDRSKQIFYKPEAYQNVYCHLDPEARSQALECNRVKKVDRIDYAPKQPSIFEEEGVLYANTWCDSCVVSGKEGDVSRWLDHWDALGWGEHRKHCLQWMAYTILYPEHKINHMLVMGSAEGCGKDFLLAPLVKAMGKDHTTINGEGLLSQFNQYLMSTKYLNINEVEFGDRNEASHIASKLKPLATCPPDRIPLNEKGLKNIWIRNIVNCTITTNDRYFIRLENGPSRRYYFAWSDLNIRGEDGNYRKEWVDYWVDRWDWMDKEGIDACIWYLRNKVDLSDFNPSIAPPMTDALRDITEASKSPLLQTIEGFIQRGVGAFGSDLMTCADMVSTIKAGFMICPELVLCDERAITPLKIVRALSYSEGLLKREVCKGKSKVKLWIVRNGIKYSGMSSKELYIDYEKQLIESRTKNKMKVV